MDGTCSFISRVIILASLSLILFNRAARPEPLSDCYSVVYDPGLSMVTGGGDLRALHALSSTGVDRVIGIHWFDETWIWKKPAAIGLRLAKSRLVDRVLTRAAFLSQHEIFGHGARYREFGFNENTYQISWASPYGEGGGWARRGPREWPDIGLSPHEHLVIHTGGVEANAILAGEIQWGWLRSDRIHYREASLFLSAYNDLLSYVRSTRENLADNTPGHDIFYYLQWLHSLAREGYPSRLSAESLKKRALVNLANPFLFFSLYTYLKTYLWSGENQRALPMLRLGALSYLPSLRMVLAPFGPEYHCEQFFRHRQRVFALDVSVGDGVMGFNWWGVGLKTSGLIRFAECVTDFRFNLWEQPSMWLSGAAPIETREGIGGSLTVSSFLPISSRHGTLGLLFDIGYKTSGYLEGQKLYRGAILRFGVSYLTTLGGV